MLIAMTDSPELSPFKEDVTNNKDAAQLEYVPEGMHSYMCNLPKKYLLPLHCIALKDSCVQCGVSVL